MPPRYYAIATAFVGYYPQVYPDNYYGYVTQNSITNSNTVACLTGNGATVINTGSIRCQGNISSGGTLSPAIVFPAPGVLINNPTPCPSIGDAINHLPGKAYSYGTLPPSGPPSPMGGPGPDTGFEWFAYFTLPGPPGPVIGLTVPPRVIALHHENVACERKIRLGM